MLCLFCDKFKVKPKEPKNVHFHLEHRICVKQVKDKLLSLHNSFQHD